MSSLSRAASEDARCSGSVPAPAEQWTHMFCSVHVLLDVRFYNLLSHISRLIPLRWLHGVCNVTYRKQSTWRVGGEEQPGPPGFLPAGSWLRAWSSAAHQRGITDEVSDSLFSFHSGELPSPNIYYITTLRPQHTSLRADRRHLRTLTQHRLFWYSPGSSLDINLLRRLINQRNTWVTPTRRPTSSSETNGHRWK